MATLTAATTEQPALGREETLPGRIVCRTRYAVCLRCGAPVRPDSPSCGWCGRLRGKERPSPNGANGGADHA